MSNKQQAAAGAGVTILAILTLVMSTQGLAFVQWLVVEAKLLFGLPLFAPVLTAVFVGAVASAWVPYLLPVTWQRPQALRLTRLMACSVAFIMVAWRYPSAIGIQYAMFAATGSYVAWTVAQNHVYRWWPALRPEALIDRDAFCDGVRRAALAEGRRAALMDVQRLADEVGEGGGQTATRVREWLVK